MNNDALAAALKRIAYGYRLNAAGKRSEIMRHEMQEIAREACNAAGIEWWGQLPGNGRAKPANPAEIDRKGAA